jgi:hypothetical protein
MHNFINYVLYYRYDLIFLLKNIKEKFILVPNNLIYYHKMKVRPKIFINFYYVFI